MKRRSFDSAGAGGAADFTSPVGQIPQVGPIPAETLGVPPLGADPHDFAGLYIRHRSSFEMHARRLLNDPHDVEDVLQEAFLKLFLALPELETEPQAISYVRRTITNLCIDRYRRTARRPRLIDLDELGFELAGEDDPDPVVAAEDAALVRQALALLSPLHREALIKREVEEKPLPLIAAELGIEEKNVKHVLLRARRALRRLLVGSTVDPVGLDALSAGEVFSLTAKRAGKLAENPARIAMVLILLIAGAVGLTRLPMFSHPDTVVAGDLPRGPVPAGPTGSGSGTSATPGGGGGVVVTVPAAPGDLIGATPGTATGPTPGGSATGPSAPPSAPTAPSAQPSTRPSAQPSTQPSAPERGAAPTSPPAAPPDLPATGTDQFSTSARSLGVSGAMTSVARPVVQSALVSSTPVGAIAAEAVHNFSAQTTKGPLTIDQTVTFDGGSIKIAVDPAFVVKGQLVKPHIDGATVAKRQLGNAEGIEFQIGLSFSGATPVQASASDGLPAVPDAMAITLVLTPTLDDVQAEMVDVDPGTVPTPPAAASPAPSASSAPTDLSPAGPAGLENRQPPAGPLREVRAY